MKVLPWLVAAGAAGVAAFEVVENLETGRKVDMLTRELEQVRQNSIALEKARDTEQQARIALEKARDAELQVRNRALEAQKRALEAELARVARAKAQAETMATEASAAAERARRANAPRPLPGSDARKAAMDLEGEGRGQEAVRMYVSAARSGNCEAAARLGDIYDKGLAGMHRDYAESLKWYGMARALGCDVPPPHAR